MLSSGKEIPARHHVVGIETDFDFLSQEYTAFYRPGRGTAFQAPLWQKMIHARLAPELGACQHTVVVRDSLGRLAAVFPLVRQKIYGMTILQPADFGVCDYNAPVADTATLERFAGDADLLKRLGTSLKPADLVLLRKVRTDGFDLARLFPSAVASAGENAAYLCETGLDFDVWRNRILRRKFTKELGRLQRQTERENGPYEHRLLTDASEIRAAFAFMRETRRGRYDESLLDDPLHFDFYVETAVAGAGTGETRTYASYIEGELCAALFGANGDGQYHAVLIGADIDRHSRLSTGKQLLYRVAEMRMREGFGKLDLGIGESGYKEQFRPVETSLRNYSIARTAAGSALAHVYHRSKPLKNVLRRFASRLR